MKTPLFLAVIAASVLAVSGHADATYLDQNSAVVTNGNDSGPGSFRAALENGATSVRFSRSVSSVSIVEPLVYDGERALRISGSGQTIDAAALQGDADILSISVGADLSISGLSFIGGAFDVNPNPNEPTGGKGIFVNVPETREGIVRVRLSGVSVAGVGNHGIHVSDCTLRDLCGGGSAGGGEGSPASVYVKLDDVTINRVGFGRQDADGVRVDERGDGSIYFAASNSIFANVGADGIELDEGNDGDVVVNVNDSVFDSNGEYCLAIPFLVGGPCDDDGDPDVDDGFDIDEAGEGSLYARVANTKVSNNFDEGLDFDEEDAGDIVMRVSQVTAFGNEDEGIKASEEGEGGLRTALRRVTTSNNNGSKEGIELEEADDGDVNLSVLDSLLIGGDDEELKVVQEDQGAGRLQIRRSNIEVLDLEGVSVIR